ncbi:5059_t:CDS:2 [Paraglomus occultum]|uniref:5059_t:CDS:1 n=1 Tax=Paraglomus occultum TaxID=144539 RepID=A0A9N8WC31_9GLOM|nr:5059_t:CDS:2 [Paraglomus occultum]
MTAQEQAPESPVKPQQVSTETETKRQVKHEIKTDDIEVSSTVDLEKRSTPTDLAAGTQQTVFLTLRQRIPLVLGLCLAIFLCGLDNTISATAMPAIAEQFNSLADITYIATAFILTFNSFIPLSGKLCDVFGRRPVMLGGILIFLLGSALCGAATSMIMLIVCRAVQGVGASAIFVCTMIVFTDISALEDRAKYQGIIALVFSFASVVGPLIGGLFVDHVTWRWGFYINLPVGAVSLVIAAILLRTPAPKGSMKSKLARIDYIGTFLIVSATTLFLLGITWAGTKYAWRSAPTISLFIIAGLLYIALGFYEVFYAVEPIVPPHLFKIRTAVAVYLGAPLFLSGFFSLMYFLPIFWQVAKHTSATVSGLRLLPMPVGLVVSSSLATVAIMKLGRVKELLLLACCLGATGLGLVSLFKVDDSLGMEIGVLFLFGLGLGLCWSLSVVAVQAAVDLKDLAIATSNVNFFQMFGGAVGVAISATVFNNSLGSRLVGILPSDQISIAQTSISFVMSLEQSIRDQVINAYVESLRVVWYVQAGIMVLAFVAYSFVKHYPVRVEDLKNAGGAI